MSAVRVVCAVIVNEAGLVLACKRGSGRFLGGKWEFPGGKVEPQESAEEALHRELREELAISVLIHKNLSEVRWNYGRGNMLLLPFVCGIRDGKPQALEHEQIRWCDAAELVTLDWAEADVPVLREYLETMR
jgi:8-oxo-dGTP diphosphatase